MSSKKIIILVVGILSSTSYAMRPMMTLMEYSNDFINELKSYAEPTQNPDHLRCSRPCQRIPNMVKLQTILTRYGLTENFAGLIEAEGQNAFEEIDIGKCSGSCRALKSQSVRVSAVILYDIII